MYKKLYLLCSIEKNGKNWLSNRFQFETQKMDVLKRTGKSKEMKGK